VAAFHRGLSEAGYVEGQNITLEYRWAENHNDRLPALAADLVGRKVDLIVSSGSLPAALAAKSATSTIPIVFTGVSDPVAAGLVASLARPGGNLTGFSPFQFELMPKRLELLTELVPRARVIALLVNPDRPPESRGPRERLAGSGAHEGGAAPYPEGQHRGRDRRRFRNPRPTTGRCARRQPRSAFQQPARAAPGAGLAPCRSGDLSVARSDCGGRPDQLWSQITALYSKAAIYAGRILKGEKPADLPVQQPTTFELVVNLK
jgi:putative ABC transport system substrate-binding protein